MVGLRIPSLPTSKGDYTIFEMEQEYCKNHRKLQEKTGLVVKYMFVSCHCRAKEVVSRRVTFAAFDTRRTACTHQGGKKQNTIHWLLLFVREDGGHAHSRSDTHAGDEELAARFPRDRISSGDLPCASFRRGKVSINM